MSYNVTMTLVSKTQEANVGDTWKYDLEAKVFCQGLQGETTVSVPKHELKSGEVQPPHGKTGFSRDFYIATGVRESPGIRNHNAVFTLRLRVFIEKSA